MTVSKQEIFVCFLHFFVYVHYLLKMLHNNYTIAQSKVHPQF